QKGNHPVYQGASEVVPERRESPDLVVHEIGDGLNGPVVVAPHALRKQIRDPEGGESLPALDGGIVDDEVDVVPQERVTERVRVHEEGRYDDHGEMPARAPLGRARGSQG